MASSTKLTIAASLNIQDPRRLWLEAYQLISSSEGFDADVTEDLIGTIEAPNLVACVETILASPDRLPGTEYEDLVVRSGDELVSDMVICHALKQSTNPGEPPCQWAEKFSSYE